MNQREFDMFVESPTPAEVWAALGRGGPTCTSRLEGRPCLDCLPAHGTPWIQLPSFCLNCPVFAVELRQHRVYLHSYNSSRCSCSLQGTGLVADWHWYTQNLFYKWLDLICFFYWVFWSTLRFGMEWLVTYCINEVCPQHYPHPPISNWVCFGWFFFQLLLLAGVWPLAYMYSKVI